MDENKNIETLKQQGWDDMSDLLDTHMPEEKIRPVIWWYWLAGAAAVLLAVAIPITLIMKGGSADSSLLATQEQVQRTEEKSTSIADDRMELSDGPVKPDATGKVARSEGLVYKTDQDRPSGTPFVKSIGSKEDDDMITGQKELNNDRHSVAGKTGVASESAGNNLPTESFGQIRLIQGMTRLDPRFFQVEKPDLSFAPIYLDKPEKIEVSKATNKLNAIVFAETMWSLSDRFGFVNAGPGIQYAIGKWSVGLAGGLALPLPRQKAFYESNSTFSGQYNFANGLDSKFEMSAPGISGSVYYENYTMKPGFIFSISVQRQISNKWGISADLGRLGFRYDFTRKAEPNQNIAANTQLPNLKNSLWYTGLSVNYQLGNHWMLYGGTKLVNIFNTGEAGLLPAVRVEYAFN